uniref:Uncharacterized protein n=1 Tax=Rhizophora mucronata TaxID=61149 RepID=A0A2P2R168_RHIMU
MVFVFSFGFPFNYYYFLGNSVIYMVFCYLVLQCRILFL